MTGEWNFNRRDFLKVGGTLAAGLAFRPGISFAAEGDILRIRTNGDLQVLDPAFMIGNIEEMIMRCIYVSLNRLGDIRQGAPWAPYGAETLEQVDAKTIKFTLIPGLKWTGGFGAVTPEDVKFSYERIANPDNQSPWAYQFEKLDNVEVVDDRTGIIRLKEPYQPIFVTSIPYYGGHIVSKAATEKVGGPRRSAASSRPSRPPPAAPTSSTGGSRSRRWCSPPTPTGRRRGPTSARWRSTSSRTTRRPSSPTRRVRSTIRASRSVPPRPPRRRCRPTAS
jgi:ABC-type transport system substrate-binding protein